MELAINRQRLRRCRSPTPIFGREFSEDLVHQVVVAYRNAGRAGTKAQKTRSEVNGTTKKFEEAEGRRCARHGALTGSDLRRRQRDVRGQAAQLRAEGQPQDVPRRDVRDPVRAQPPGSHHGRRVVRPRRAEDARRMIAKLDEPGSGSSSADRHRGRVRESVPLGSQHAVRRSARRPGPGSGQPRRRRFGRDSPPTRSRRSRSGWHERRPSSSASSARRACLGKDCSSAGSSTSTSSKWRRTATKADVKVAVETLFERQGRGGQRGQREGQEQVLPQFRAGRRGDWRKAYVTPGRRPVDRRDGQGLRTDPWH